MTHHPPFLFPFDTVAGQMERQMREDRERFERQRRESERMRKRQEEEDRRNDRKTRR